MGFNTDKFMQEKLEAPRKRVPVPVLAAWFDDGDEPVWEVRGLTASELHRAVDAMQQRDSVENIVKALTASGDQAKAVREAIGLSTNTPGEVVKRLEMLVIGSVTPKIELPTAVKLAESFPIEFLGLTNDITRLTGMGYDVVKPIAVSQPTQA